MAGSKSVEMEIRLAAQQFLRELERLETEHGAAMKAMGGDASNVAQILDNSFKVLGVRSIQALDKEVEGLQEALANLRKSPDVLPEDKARAVKAFNDRLAELRTEAGRTGPSLGNIEQPANRAGEALASAAHKAAAWTAALVGINSLTDVGRQIVETGSQFENLQVRLENLLGSTEKADVAFTMIKDLASSTPFEVAGLTESFIKLTAMGMQPTEAQMRSLSDVAANLGGGTEVLTGVTTALGQAWAKGKLQGEEIMQLAERGVPVWDALARATGRSVPELQRLSEAGSLGRDVIGQLIDELGRMNAGASDKLMNTYAGAVANAKDALAEFFDMISKAGVLDWLTAKVRELLAEFDRMKESGELEAKAKAIADAFLDIATVVEEVIGVMVELAPVLLKVAEAAVALKVANMAGTLLSIATSARTATAAVTTMGASSAATAVQMEAAAVSGGRFATVLRLVRSLSVAGLVMGAAELAMEFFRAKRAAEEGDEAVRKMLESSPVNGPRDAAKATAVAMDEATKKVGDAKKEFDSLIEKGSSAAEALSRIGKGFDLSTGGGIRTATVVLDDLLKSARITSAQFNEAWATALKNVDLIEFGVRARLAMENAADGGKALAAALDAGLREAIRRSGADFDVLSGGMGKASASAINDVEAIIDGLDRLKSMGVDTGLALSSSLTKAISTADSEKALDAVRARIEAVRGELGSKVADGLLDQARKKSDELAASLDKAIPGINSVAEAMRTLGVTSDESLRRTAGEAKQSYDVVRLSGTASAREVSEAFKRAAEAAIAANGGIAPAWVQAEAAMRGYTVVVDSAGKATLQLKAASEEAGGAISNAMGRAGGRVDELRDKVRQAAKELSGIRSADGIDWTRNVTSRTGGGAVTYDENTGLQALLDKQSAGTLSADDLALARTVLQASQTNLQIMQSNRLAYSFDGQQSTETAARQAQTIFELVNGMKTSSGSSSSSGGQGINQSVTHTVNVKFGSKSQTVNVASADDAAMLKTLVSELAAAAGRAS